MLDRPLSVMTLVLSSILINIPAQASGDLSKQAPQEIRLELGDAEGKLELHPASLRFETGKLYKLVISNPATAPRYLSSDGFARAVYTRKVQINDKTGKALAEIKGSVREIEVYPGASAEWWFVPVAAGRFSDMKCPVMGNAPFTGELVVE